MFSWRKKNGGGGQGSSDPAPATPDAELVRAARAGDKRAFVEIVARHQAMVCGIALGILNDFAASEDAAQEAFLTAWRKFHDLREPERLRGWLGQIARNAALGHLRRTRGHDDLEHALAVADESPAPDELAASEEEAALVRESLSRLPETYRLPLILYYREGQSIRAVAESLALSEDAVKQRLARGREMLRDQMSGLVETVLTRTTPTAVFTMTIAVAIGALAAPAAIAGAIFATTSAATATAAATTSTTTNFLAAMSTSKAALITAALVAVVCVPVGYHVAAGRTQAVGASTNATVAVQAEAPPRETNEPPTFESSALFAEWRKLHETYGSMPQSMPALYKAIADIKDPFRRRAFRAALISEWVQLDPTGGLRFFTDKKNDTSQRRQFFDEWLNVDATNAVTALLASGTGWEGMARDSLKEIAKRVPGRVPEIVSRLPKSDNYWDTKVRDAFEIVAESGLAWARKAAEGINGPNREQALGGVAQAWARTDLTSALAWAKSLPAGTDRDEIIRAALIGKASSDPLAALDAVEIVPPGGRSGYFATTTGARVLREAAKADYEGTVAWLTEHPGRLGHEDMMGLAEAVTDRINADPIRFLSRSMSEGSLKAILPAVDSALLNDAGGQRTAIWDWLKNQPQNDSTKALRDQLFNAAGYQDPPLAMRIAAELPRTPDADQQIQTLARSLLNGGQMLASFDKFYQDAPERMRGPLMDAAFTFLRPDTLNDPRAWISRIAQLPQDAQARGMESLARAWAGKAPEEAVAWVNTLPAGDTRSAAVADVAGTWAANDPGTAAAWVSAMAPGGERDRSAKSLAFAIADRYPGQALDWALSIGDENERMRSALQVAQLTAARKPSIVEQWIETGPYAPDVKAKLQAALAGRGGKGQ